MRVSFRVSMRGSIPSVKPLFTEVPAVQEPQPVSHTQYSQKPKKGNSSAL